MTDLNAVSHVNWAAIEKRIISAGVIGLNATGRYAQAQAQHYAPVRAIFARARRGPQMPKGEYEFTAANMVAYRRSLPRSIQVRGVAGFDKTQVRGHANSFEPVFRAGDTKITGDFRRWSPGSEDRPPALVAVSHISQRKGGPLRFKSAEKSAMVTNNQLTQQGRGEVKSGRAAFTTEGTTRIGGRLRGEIRLVEGKDEGQDVIWANLVSATQYAHYQEYGSAHNRAHPYMRPALYDARGRLRQQVQRAIGR